MFLDFLNCKNLTSFEVGRCLVMLLIQIYLPILSHSTIPILDIVTVSRLKSAYFFEFEGVASEVGLACLDCLGLSD